MSSRSALHHASSRFGTLRDWLLTFFLVAAGAFIGISSSRLLAPITAVASVGRTAPISARQTALPSPLPLLTPPPPLLSGAVAIAGVPSSSTSTSSTADAPDFCRPRTRYVRLTNDPAGKILQLSEVEAVDAAGVNVARGKPCSASSTLDQFRCQNIVDGSAVGAFFASAGGAPGEFVEVDLGADVELAGVTVHNRDDSTGTRMEGQQLLLLDSNRAHIGAFLLRGVTEGQTFDASILACPGHSQTNTATTSATRTHSPTHSASLSVGASPPTKCSAAAFYEGFAWSARKGSESVEWAPSPLCPPFTVAEATACLAGQHVLFIGDSVTRFQYTNLAYWLATGLHEAPEGTTTGRRNENVGGGWGGKDDAASWVAYFKETQARFGAERDVCDCFHDYAKFGWPDFAAQCPTNRYWFGPPGSRMRLSYVQWWDKWPLLGHSAEFLGLQCFEEAVAGKGVAADCRQSGCQAGACAAPFDWSYPTTTPEERIDAMLRTVESIRPTVDIFSSMVWHSYDSPQQAQVLLRIFSALHAKDPALRIFWKTSAAVADSKDPEHLFERDLVQLIEDTAYESIDQSLLLQPAMRAMAAGELKQAALYLFDHVHPTAAVHSAVNEATLMHICRSPKPRKTLK